MIKIFLCISIFMTTHLYAQTVTKPDPNSSINAQEQINGLPGGGATGTTYSVKTKKRAVKAPDVVAPVENTTPANCASALGGTGGANFTACEAEKRSR